MKQCLLLLIVGLVSAMSASEEPFFRLASNLPVKGYKAQIVTTETPSMQFSFAAQPEAMTCEVSDFWSNKVWEGSIIAGEKILNLTMLPPGYYQLAARCGDQQYRSSFVVVDQNMPEVSFDSPFGIGTHIGQGWSDQITVLLRAAGFSWFRDEAGWGYVEQKAGELDFSPIITARLKRAAGRMHWLSVLSYGNKHYDKGSAPFSEAGYAAWRRYVRESVKAYPEVQFFECWNEYNAGFNMYGITEPTPANYVKLLKITYEEIKATRPEAVVIGGSTAVLPMEWIEELFKLGGLQYMDVFSVHPYRWGQWTKVPETLYHDMVQVRELIGRYANGREIPVIADELSWPVDLRYRISESRQAAYFVRAYTNLQRAGVAKTFWYNFMATAREGYFAIGGLSKNERYLPRPAYAAAAVMTRELDSGYAGPFPCPEPGIAMQYRGDRLCLWTQEQKPTAFELFTDASLTVTDFMGGVAELTPVDGKVVLILGEYPVYIRGKVEKIGKSTLMDLQPESLTVSEKSAMNFTFTAPADTVLQLDKREFAPGRFAVTGSSLPDMRNIRGELWRGGKRNGLAVMSIEMTPQLETAMVRVLENGTLRLSLNNLNPELRESITELEISLDGQAKRTTLSLPYEMPSVKLAEIDLLHLDTTPYKLHQLELKVSFANHPPLAFSGRVGYSPCYYRSDVKLDGSLDKWRDQPSIDLAAFGRMACLTPDLRETLQKFGGKVWIAWNEENFYLIAAIDDPVHVQKFPVWQGDSLQFGVAFATPPDANTTVKFESAFNDRGQGWIFPSGPLGFDQQNLQKYSRLRMTRTENQSVYELMMPWKYIRFVKPSDGMFRFSILANNNDDGRRMGYLEWGGGIGDTKGTLFFPVCEFKR